MSQQEATPKLNGLNHIRAVAAEFLTVAVAASGCAYLNPFQPVHHSNTATPVASATPFHTPNSVSISTLPVSSRPTLSPTETAATPTSTETSVTPSPTATATKTTETKTTPNPNIDNSISKVPSCNRPAGSKAIVTIDDYGTPKQIDAYLTALRKENMKAIFFPVGQFVEGHPELIKKIKEAGHEVGYHTYDHPQLSTLTSDIEKLKQEVTPPAGLMTTELPLLRLPYGDGAENKKLLTELTKLNMQACTWKDDSRDWDGSTREKIMNRLTVGDKYSPDPVGPGDVILFHMHSKHGAETIPYFAKWMRKKGILYETLTNSHA